MAAASGADAVATAAVLDAWRDAVGFEVEPTDRFSDVGGTSLLAEKVLADLRRSYWSSLTVAVLMDDPTAAELGSRLARARRQGVRSARTFATLRPPATPASPSVLCVAGAGASVACWLPLAAEAPPGVGVHAVHAAGLENRGRVDWTVAAAARRHLRDWLATDPAGPLVVIGHSFGGRIAAEIDHLLAAHGRPAAGLLLLDTLHDLDATPVLLDGQVPPVPPRGERWAMHWRVYTAGPVQYRHDRHRVVMGEQARRVQRRHTARPLPTHGTVFVSDEYAPQAEAWRSTADLGATIERVPGTHHDLIADPALVRRVADRLRRILE